MKDVHMKLDIWIKSGKHLPGKYEIKKGMLLYMGNGNENVVKAAGTFVFCRKFSENYIKCKTERCSTPFGYIKKSTHLVNKKTALASVN